MKQQIIYRLEKTLELCRGKKVLNLGYVQHRNWQDRMKKGIWFHEKLCRISNKVVGIDILANEIKKINKLLERDDIAADVTKLKNIDLNDIFEVIFCGELIEHLANPGLMLDGIKKFMDKNSILVVTTPNVFYEKWVRKAWKGLEGKDFLNEEHVCWYSFQTLKQLLDRYNYKEEFYSYYYSNSKKVTKFNYIKNLIKRILYIFFKKVDYAPLSPEAKQMGLYFVAKLK